MQGVPAVNAAQRDLAAGEQGPELIFPRSGGHLSKLGMIRAEVKDGSKSADIHG